MRKIIFSAAVLATVFIDAQNTGIGTTSPTQKLDVNGSVRTRGQFIQDGYDFILGSGNQVERGDSGPSRAIVKGGIADASNNQISRLILNYSNDYKGGILLSGIINMPNLGLGNATNNLVVMDDNYNLLKIPASTWGAANSVNIYNSNGQLSANRSVDQNNHLLSFINGDVLLAKSIFSNGQLELNNTDTGDRTTFIDFHSTDGADFNTRLYRGPGVNAPFVIQNTGTGKVLIANPAYVQGNFGLSGFDFTLGDGDQTTRGNSAGSRALVKDGDATKGAQLHINYGNDFAAGTSVDSKLFIVNTSGAADPANDKVLTIGSNGEVKNSNSTLSSLSSSTEPWRIATTANPATANDQNIFQMGNVGIGTNNPTSTLHVQNSGGPAAQFQSSSDAVVRLIPNNTVDNRFAIQTVDSEKTTHLLGFNAGTSNANITINHTNGNLGINAPDASQKLDVNGNARVRQMPSGNDEATYSRVLVADASGNLATISRTDPGVPNATQTIFSNPKVSTDISHGQSLFQIQQNYSTLGAGYYRYCGQSITLPRGKWIIYAAYLVSPNVGPQGGSQTFEDGTSAWFRCTISESSADGIGANSAVIAGSPTLISTSLGQASVYQVASGVWLVDNNTGADKTFYMRVSIQPYGFTAEKDKVLSNLSIWAEDYLFAIKRS